MSSRKYDTDNSGKIGLAEYKKLASDLGQVGLSDRDYAAGLLTLDKVRIRSGASPSCFSKSFVSLLNTEQGWTYRLQ